MMQRKAEAVEQKSETKGTVETGWGLAGSETLERKAEHAWEDC